jgi:hypothetical protein
MLFFTYNIPPPNNIVNMFDNWLNEVNKQDKAIIGIGLSALCSSIWNCTNDIVFSRQRGTTFLQVIYRAVHWI